MRVAWLLVICGCGRIGFTDRSALGDAAADGDDGSTTDAGLPLPIVEYSFEATAGVAIVDSRSNLVASCAPASTCPSSTLGHRGNGYRFDGTDDCIAVPDTGGILDPSAFTIALWANQGVTGNVSQFSKRLGAADDNTWQLESGDLANADALSFTSADVVDIHAFLWTANGSIKLNQWQHLAITWDGATKRVYIDGAAVASAGGNPLVYDSQGARIGCDQGPVLSEFFNGTLDEIQLYDQALTAGQIATLATL